MPRTATAGILTPFQFSINEALETFKNLRALEADLIRAVEVVTTSLRAEENCSSVGTEEAPAIARISPQSSRADSRKIGVLIRQLP